MPTQSKPSSQQSKAQATRHRILLAAHDAFHRHGFQGTSLNLILDHAKITKGALFHHFTNKDDLGLQVIDEIIRPYVHSTWIDPLAQSVNPLEDIAQILRNTLMPDRQSLCQGCPLNNLAQEMSPLHEQFRQRIQQIYADWRQALSQAFQRGQQNGLIRPNLNPDTAAAFVVAAVSGIIGTAKNAQCTELLNRAGQGLLDYLESLRR